MRARIGIAQRDVVLPTLDGALAVEAGEVVVICVVEDVETATETVKALEAASTVRRKLAAARGKR